MPDGKYKYDDYYKANATLAYFKHRLDPVLRAKDEKGFDEFNKGLIQARMTGDQAKVTEYIEKHPFQAYLSQDEIRNTLGLADYNKYINSLQFINNFDRQEFNPNDIKGKVESATDLTAYNYGRRFSSVPVVTSISTDGGTNGVKSYTRQAIYNPKTGQADIVEYGDKGLYQYLPK